jgi:hypothetical protein
MALLVQNRDETFSSANRAQQGQAPVTTEGDKMERPAAVVAKQFFAHGMEKKSKSRPFQTKTPRRVAGTLKPSMAGAPVSSFFKGWGF